MAKNILQSWKSLDAVALTADRAGNATNILGLDNVAVHIQCGAGATGTFYVQASNLPSPTTNDWVSLVLDDGTGTPLSLAVSGSATQFLANLPNIGAQWLRVIYTFTSGTGTASAYVTGKG